MFDNLRDDAESSFYDDDTLPPDEELNFDAPPPKRKSNDKLLGMTPIQRFIIAVMLMVAVCTLGTMCLLVTGKIGIL